MVIIIILQPIDVDNYDWASEAYYETIDIVQKQEHDFFQAVFNDDDITENEEISDEDEKDMASDVNMAIPTIEIPYERHSPSKPSTLEASFETETASVCSECSQFSRQSKRVLRSKKLQKISSDGDVWYEQKMKNKKTGKRRIFFVSVNSGQRLPDGKL